MWTIRQEQNESFRQYHLKKFEDEMVEHLEKFSPQRCKVAGESAVRQLIRLGVVNANKYAFTNRGPLRLYLEFMFLFGSQFDTDPQYSWIGTTLNDRKTADQTLRADRLYNDLLVYWDRVFGPDQSYLMQAIRRLSETRIQDYVVRGMNLDESISQQLARVYPQKCEILGESGIRGLIRHSYTIADRLGLAIEAGRIVTVALVLAVGHGFYSDPLYAWIGRRLDQKRWPNPEDRVRELYSKSMIYLKHAVSESEKT